MKSTVAAVEMKPSDFLPHAAELKEDRKRSPFLGNWLTPDKMVIKAVEGIHNIYIAPVLYEGVRPLTGMIPRMEYGAKRRNRNMPTLAKYLHKQFVKVFKTSKTPRFKVVDAPVKDALTLELSILEWVPNTYTGFLVREILDDLTLDGAAMLLLKGTRGLIAIEGRLIEPKSKQSLFEFADKEVGKTIFLLPFQEFRPSGQAHFAICEWARQFEELLRTGPDVKVKDSLPVGLINF